MSEVSTRDAKLSGARIAGAADRVAVDAFLAERNADVVARLGELVDARTHPALIVEAGGAIEGVLTWILDGDSMEVVTLHAAHQWRGTGTALIAGARGIAEAAGARRLWLITTNDNLDALRFYQRRGFRLAALHAGAVDRARATLKPAIPDVGLFGIPLRDELELEMEVGGPVAESGPSDAEALLGLEVALARRDEAAIPGGYEAVLADGFIEIGASGRVWMRPEMLVALTAEPPNDAIDIERFEVTPLGDDAVLATYDAVSRAPDGTHTRSRRCSTWIRRGGRWQLRFHQGTPVPPDRA
jgi:GNAT superfamily N-acetyltransferase